MDSLRAGSPGSPGPAGTEADIFALINLPNKRNGSNWRPSRLGENNAGIINVSTSRAGP